jgi:hypothetical protein
MITQVKMFSGTLDVNTEKINAFLDNPQIELIDIKQFPCSKNDIDTYVLYKVVKGY